MHRHGQAKSRSWHGPAQHCGGPCGQRLATQNTDPPIRSRSNCRAFIPANGLPAAFSSGDHTQTLTRPGSTATMPPPTPRLPWPISGPISARIDSTTRACTGSSQGPSVSRPMADRRVCGNADHTARTSPGAALRPGSGSRPSRSWRSSVLAGGRRYVRRCRGCR